MYLVLQSMVKKEKKGSVENKQRNETASVVIYDYPLCLIFIVKEHNCVLYDLVNHCVGLSLKKKKRTGL